MSEYRVEYDNDTGTGGDCFFQWWDVTNDETSYECSSRDEADALCRTLNSHDDLVAALNEFIECVQRVDPGVYNDTIDMAKAALAKAEGAK